MRRDIRSAGFALRQTFEGFVSVPAGVAVFCAGFVKTAFTGDDSLARRGVNMSESGARDVAVGSKRFCNALTGRHLN